MSKQPRPLAEMDLQAAHIIAALTPYCERIAVAGSVRRRKPMCADLELVAIPKMVPAGLFGDRQTSALHAFLHTQLIVWLKGDNPDGRYHQFQLPDGLQVDLFLAAGDNWGLIYMIRTGSADFSAAMLTRWKARQGIGRERQGSIGGRLVTRHGNVMATPEEQDVFAAVGVAPVPPEQRTDGSVLRAIR